MEYQIYNDNGKNILKINILQQKICTYDCIFCPVGRGLKSDKIYNFNDTNAIIKELENIINTNSVDLVFINSKGEALLHSGIKEIISFIKSKNIKVKLLSNGYILYKYKEIANLCDEVIGEIKAINEADFQKLQRPIENYTVENLIKNMAEFKKQYSGKFILNITILNSVNNNEKSLNEIISVINEIKPDKITVEKEDDVRFIKKYGVNENEFNAICKKLCN